MTTRENRELIDRLLSRFQAHVGTETLRRVETTLREAAAKVGEHDVHVRLPDLDAVVTLRGRGPTLAQRLWRAFK